ncbi:uncharacterized protein LOC111701091 isoform X2 [Eurytemora carolleeae]|uniref:uncharacterized protein LOC111701091 isoform X2 n=1 Tax=Eurytemora carolleeae TaxID=1294199 RepID=UPI000C76C186|nr:uncharacterized protein LOC111701091 isoform X2 [Eurytemora carolleeae]|eukprot:XP_023328005.1 uncharacterized protein LOC111701091 isoform X2 [Eurytemora affinis]
MFIFQMTISTIIFGIIFSHIKCLSSTTFGLDSRLTQYSGLEPRSYPGVESRPGVKMEPRPGVRIEPRYPSYTAQTTNLVQVKWFHEDEEVYRLIPGAVRDLQRMVFKSHLFNIDISGSKMIGPGEHLLVLQYISRTQAGEYKCQVTEDSPPFAFSESSGRLMVVVLPERHPVISGVKSSTYLPGDRISINCTSRRSFPAPSLYWSLNGKMVERWMLNSYITEVDQDGLESSTLGLNFLVLPDHFRGPDRQLLVSCQAVMPSIQGEQIPLERTLVLGRLLQSAWSYQEGWSTSPAAQFTRPSWRLSIIQVLSAVIQLHKYIY